MVLRLGHSSGTAAGNRQTNVPPPAQQLQFLHISRSAPAAHALQRVNLALALPRDGYGLQYETNPFISQKKPLISTHFWNGVALFISVKWAEY